MKRIIFLLIIVTVFAFAFTSCDDANKGSSDTNDTSATDTSTTATRTTISADEWDAMTKTTNYTLHFNVKSTDDNGYETIYRLIKSTDTSMYLKSEYNLYDTEESYYIVAEGQPYRITLWNEQLQKWDDKTWHAYATDWEPRSMNEALGFGREYEDLVYDNQKKAYVYTKAEDGFVGVISYYFEDGILIRVTADVYETDSVADIDERKCIESIRAVFSSVGTTDIEIPEYIIEDEKLN